MKTFEFSTAFIKTTQIKTLIGFSKPYSSVLPKTSSNHCFYNNCLKSCYRFCNIFIAALNITAF